MDAGRRRTGGRGGREMIIVAKKIDGSVIARYEAWATGAYENALADIDRDGFHYLSEEITMMGNMIIWVQ